MNKVYALDSVTQTSASTITAEWFVTVLPLKV